MKILYTNFQSNDGGGHVTYILGLAKALNAQHDISIATPPTSRLFRFAKQAGIKVHEQWYTSRINRMIPEVRALRRYLKQERFDLIHCNGSADHRHIMLACLGLKNRPALVWTKHNDYSVNSLGNRLRARLATDTIIAVSDYVSEIIRQSPYRHKPLKVVRHGIDTARFAPVTVQEKQELRKKHFRPVFQPLVLLGSSAGTDWAKGWLSLVEAVADLPSDLKQQVGIVVIGAFPNAEKQQKVRELGMEDRVIFPGLIQDVRPWLAACDMGFVLSEREALSYACREAMALGLPVLVSDAGGLPENIHNKNNGWIIPVGNVAAIRAVLKQVLNHPNLLVEMGKAARITAEKEFSMTEFVAHTLDVYEQVLNEKLRT